MVVFCTIISFDVKKKTPVNPAVIFTCRLSYFMLLLNLHGCSTLNVFTDWLTLHHHKYFQITINFNRLWPSSCWSISITIAIRHVNTSWSWLPVRSEHPLLPRQYVINAPVTISAGYIKRIAEVVKKAIKDALHDEISNTIVEKLIIKNPPQQLQIENTNHSGE